MHNKTYYNTANEAFRAKWKVCDGAPGSGTPDLRNLFLRGMADGGTAAVGSDSVTLAASNLPSHSHTFTGNNATGVINIISGSFTAGGVFSRYPATQNNHITAPIQGTDDSIAFSMTPSGSVTGGGGNPQTAISIVPKYYAVIYVMKIA
jgi:microcystin-dependent protein